ncbi:hypothetical protein [Streptomyces albidoflavus]|uniref:hypothetical protein n=1 Tax=Streptomyces albidoflavus TaxID=1886 RepID=UPI00101E4A57|nr:hypothetical protein [Streptomyces albidoflavus]
MSSSDHDRADLARRAAEAGNVAMQALGDFGLGSPELDGALTAAKHLADEAEAAGITPEEFKAARRKWQDGAS